MVITLTDTGAKKGTADSVKMYFPVPPEKIDYKTAAYFKEYSIINKGIVKIPSGTDVSEIGWECFFPGERLQNMPFVISKKKLPAEYHKQLESWKENGAKLKLNITGTPFSFDVYIDTYDVTAQDAHGSLYYKINFAKAIAVTVETTTNKKASKTTTRSSKTSSQKKYTVKNRDTLWDISIKFYGSKNATKWTKIYDANKSKIEAAAKKHGRKSSNKGHYIYAGTVLSIP